jgi:3-hydroxyisobutyrate dehydrogenase
MNVGFVGLGIMGQPMAANLIKAGFALTVFDRDAERAGPLAKLGARAAASPAEVARASETLITMLPETPDVKAVLFEAGGVAGALRPGSVFIDMSTISASASVEFARRLRERSIEMLDAPVSGGEPGAQAARLSIMVGGEKTVFERCLPLFQAMGNNVVYAGPSGFGQKTKLVNQIVGSLNLLAMVEGMRVAAAAGLDLKTTIQAVSGGAAGSWMWSNLAPRVAERDYRPGFMIRHHAKDLRLTVELLHELGLEASGTELCHRLFQQAMEKGLGELGNQGLIRLWW